MSPKKAKEVLERRMGFLARRILTRSPVAIEGAPPEPDPSGYGRKELRALELAIAAIDSTHGTTTEAGA